MKRTFTKQDSQAMKGIAILLMLLHHLFYSADSSHGLPVSYLLLDTRQVVVAARFCKICVPAFVFVTAYGMAVKYEAYGQGREPFLRLTLKRYISLMVSFLFVYVLAFVFCQIGGMRSYGEVYGSGAKSVIYAVIDMLGMTYFTGTPSMNPTWWYMSVAVLLIFALPLLWRLAQMADILPVILTAGIMLAAGLWKNQAMLCLLTAGVGIFCERRKILERLAGFWDKSRWYRMAGCLILTAGLAVLLLLKVRTGNRFWIVIYPVSAVFIAKLLCLGSRDGKISKILQFFGRYSMYMFLTHTFLKSYYLHDFIYGFRQAELIYAVLVGISLILAMLLARLEKKFRQVLHIDERLQKLAGG
ncbi:MAG: acyltransferase [Firmicutes bacterium]|nr:acyltransferase [Bacillota bacterium]